MLISETAMVKWNAKNVKYYTDKGYTYTKKGDNFEVKIEDLSPYSTAIVEVLCDYCLEEGIQTIILKPYSRYVQNNLNSIIHKDACVDSKCSGKKIKEVMMAKHGVECSLLTEHGKESFKNTMLDRYGVEHPLQVPEFKAKAEETFMNNYGFISPLSCPEVQNKIKATNLERCGYEYLFSSPEIQEKNKQTNLERYGYENPFDNPEVQKQIREKLYENGTCPTSLTQLYIYNVLKNNNYNVHLNYPVKTSNLDVAIPSQKIYIEYDGSGHNLQVIYGNMTQEEFDLREQRRWYALRDAGWREIRIVSQSDKIPKENKLLEIIKHCIEYLESGHSWIRLDIDEKSLISSQFTTNVNCGRLFQVKNNLKLREQLEELKLIS